MRLDAHAFIRKGRKSGDHLIERNFGRAECGRKIRSHRHFDPEATHHLRARLNADGLQQVHRRNVHGLGERSLQRQVAVAGRAIVVVRYPIADMNLRAAHPCVTRHAPLDGRRVDVRLEG